MFSVLVPCPLRTEYAHQELCYTDDKGEVGHPCSFKCVGGCHDRDQAMHNTEMCVACNNTRHYNEQGDANAFMCREKCPSLFVAVSILAFWQKCNGFVKTQTMGLKSEKNISIPIVFLLFSV